MHRRNRLAWTMCALAVCGSAQPEPQRPKPRGAMSQPQPAPADDPSFQPIFDGSMKGWDGDAKFWRADNGVLIGETTAASPLKQNTFATWQGGKPGDFELKLEYKHSAVGNSGVQYRSEAIPDRQFGLRGYQADIDAENRYTGQIYEEGGRGFLALRGQATRIQSGDPAVKQITGSLGDGAQLAALIKKEDWNQLHIIARGNTLVQVLNGQVMSVVVDDDAKGRRLDGVIGLQLHVGPPMKIEFRNIRLRK